MNNTKRIVPATHVHLPIKVLCVKKKLCERLSSQPLHPVGVFVVSKKYFRKRFRIVEILLANCVISCIIKKTVIKYPNIC